MTFHDIRPAQKPLPCVCAICFFWDVRDSICVCVCVYIYGDEVQVQRLLMKLVKSDLRQCADYYLYTNIKKKHNELRKPLRENCIVAEISLTNRKLLKFCFTNSGFLYWPTIYCCCCNGNYSYQLHLLDFQLGNRNQYMQ